VATAARHRPDRAVPAQRRGRFIAVAVVIGCVLAAGAVELLLRVAGYRPSHLCADGDEPVVYEADAQLGWRSKPGRYAVPAYAPGAPPTDMTILPDGARATGGGENGTPSLLFLGCSFTQGVALSDAETFAWRVQQRYPAWRVRNLGTGAYSTYQSLLMLERVLAEPDPPRLVFYGFIEPHEIRNVGHPLWMYMLTLCSRRGMVYTPYCTLDDDGKLVRHPPEAHATWPLREHLAAVAFLQERYTDFTAGDRPAQARRVTEELLLEMDRVAKQHGVRLCVVLLYFAPDVRAHYAEFLARHGVDFVDCVYPLTRDMVVPHEGHPNGAMNARWADCIAGKIDAEPASAF
jgi:hypothetical protein